MGDRWGYGREVLKRNGKFRMREEEVRLIVKNTESVWFLRHWTVQVVAELIFLRRYGWIKKNSISAENDLSPLRT